MKVYNGKPIQRDLILEHLKSSVWGAMTARRIADALNLRYHAVCVALIELKRDNKVTSERMGKLTIYKIL